MSSNSHVLSSTSFVTDTDTTRLTQCEESVESGESREDRDKNEISPPEQSGPIHSQYPRLSRMIYKMGGAEGLNTQGESYCRKFSFADYARRFLEGKNIQQELQALNPQKQRAVRLLIEGQKMVHAKLKELDFCKGIHLLGELFIVSEMLKMEATFYIEVNKRLGINVALPESTTEGTRTVNANVVQEFASSSNDRQDAS